MLSCLQNILETHLPRTHPLRPLRCCTARRLISRLLPTNTSRTHHSSEDLHRMDNHHSKQELRRSLL